MQGSMVSSGVREAFIPRPEGLTGVSQEIKWTYPEKKLTDLKNRLVVAKREGEGGSGMDWESGVNRCKLLHLEWVSNEILLYSPGNYI